MTYGPLGSYSVALDTHGSLQSRFSMRPEDNDLVSASIGTRAWLSLAGMLIQQSRLSDALY